MIRLLDIAVSTMCMVDTDRSLTMKNAPGLPSRS